ncbi:TPA: hypothetical protein OOF45_003831, partial [Morganella morganii]|nr:hypothetical protein [Morganella morganii]
MTEMYLVTKILDEMSYSFINTEVFGDVEIRSPKNDMEIEKKYFEQSAISVFGKPLNISDYQFSNRISVIVCASSPEEAVNFADEKFVPVLDLKSNFSVLANITLSKIAIVRNLATGEIKHHVDINNTKSRVFIKRDSDI